ncbi:hypothetical protein [Paenibacillus sp. FSL R7-0273]|nr:hypothetical protein [Paenibacillus sp. FSL R7-0273]
MSFKKESGDREVNSNSKRQSLILRGGEGTAAVAGLAAGWNGSRQM